MSLCLRDCLLPGGELSSITIRRGRIHHIGAPQRAQRVVDGKGMLLLPGLVDGHVHMRSPGLEHKEDWLTGTLAAAAGGVTTVLDMPDTTPPAIDEASLRARMADAARGCVNFGFHLGATQKTPELVRHGGALTRGRVPARPGSRAKSLPVASLKVYMTSTTGGLLVDNDSQLRELFRAWKGLITVHAGDEGTVRRNSSLSLGAEGQERHEAVHTRESIVRALKKILDLVAETGARVHICHASLKEEVALIKSAKTRGLPVTAEVTPHHLWMTRLDAAGRGNLLKVSPPLREKHDCKALWQGLQDGVIDCVATDHAPHLEEEKQRPYEEAPAGLPGLETLLPLVMTAIRGRGLPLERAARWMAERPAEIFGLAGRGRIEEGYAADLVLADIHTYRDVEKHALRTKCGWSPFEGWTLLGWPVLTVVGGRVVYERE